MYCFNSLLNHEQHIQKYLQNDINTEKKKKPKIKKMKLNNKNLNIILFLYFTMTIKNYPISHCCW